MSSKTKCQIRIRVNNRIHRVRGEGLISNNAKRICSASGMVLNAVMQLNHTILEAFDGLQIQGHVAETSRYQWNAIPNEHWGHTDDELVDRLLVKKGSDELAAAHQPDILARLLSKTAHEWADCTVHELH